ncbi:DUF4260 domain-containing protein [Herbaspirillum sp. DW155]|uniref:DUF4260 domain-containing protein n=1 Tax=Herbaspirillum sp. DW155 TaxID=3095609 RepID=UPI00309041E7|nr:DUF4260 domain-containing protein [Herbaspirillum sp. DW155]
MLKADSITHNADVGAVNGGVRRVLRAEGALLLVVAVLAYARWGEGWSWFCATFLLPDLALLGYLAGPRAGALAYNASHSTLGPLGCLLLAGAGGPPVLLPLALIWLAHIGFDRSLGYGLKRSEGFGATHLGRIGRPGKPR